MGLRTLNVHVPWTEVLSAVGTSAKGHALPARAVCPMCAGARLTIYEDTISHGAWHYCFDCGKSGDMIELAARVWKVSPGVAAARLFESGVGTPPPELARGSTEPYVEAFPAYRARVNDLVEKAGFYMPRAANVDVRVLRDRLRLESPMPLSRWEEGPGRMVGAYGHLGVERALTPGSVVGGRSTSLHRTFKGRNWTDVIIVPHYDLPGRVCGLLMVGRRGTPEDRVYKSMGFNMRLPSRPAEGGLACMWAAHNSCGTLGEHVVACGDPFLALRLQVRHYATSRIPLPLVAYYECPGVRTVNAWRALDTKVPVLWGWRLTPSLLYQALAADGRLSITDLLDTTQGRIDHFVRLSEPRDILRRVVRASKPWPDFLADWAAKQTDGAIETLLMGMEAYGVDPGRFADLSPRIAALTKLCDRPREVRCGSVVVAEKGGKWWRVNGLVGCTTTGRITDQSNATLVMNATLRVDGSRVENDKLYYTGRLIHEGDEIPWTGTAAQTTKAVFFQRVAAEGKPGTTLFVHEGWDRRLVRLAMMFGGNV